MAQRFDNVGLPSIRMINHKAINQVSRNIGRQVQRRRTCRSVRPTVAPRALLSDSPFAPVPQRVVCQSHRRRIRRGVLGSPAVVYGRAEMQRRRDRRAKESEIVALDVDPRWLNCCSHSRIRESAEGRRPREDLIMDEFFRRASGVCRANSIRRTATREIRHVIESHALDAVLFSEMSRAKSFKRIKFSRKG